MYSSLKIGKFAGIRVQIHWTFWLLFLFIGFFVFSREGTFTDLLWYSLFIAGLFICVVLHEFGHALTAKKYGINTRSITLLPIGGLASLKKMPENPKQELLVAVAGPAVNVVIAIILAIFVPVENFLGMEAEALEQELAMVDANNFFFYLLTVNIALVLFNIIPAFPMDGGRIFRALLSMKVGRIKATQVASSLGKFLALLFFLYGLFYGIILSVIAVFIWFGAHSENIMIKQIELMKGYKIRDAMITEFTKLKPGDTLESVVNKILATTEKDFLVTENGDIAGILFMSDLSQALKESGKETAVEKVMDTSVSRLEAGADLSTAYRKLNHRNRNFFPVLEDGQIVGVIDMNNINEFLTFRSAFEY
ncbi:MAG TPA: site-2 protease family protein [Balneolaceae bacterium]|nr:site-2 protease family protein [Balneolaceae bacterium]